MKILLQILIYILIIIQYTFAQGEYIPRGQNAIGGGFGFKTNKDANSALLYAGYSYQGFLDITLTYWKANGGKITSQVITPKIFYYILKEEDSKRAVSLSASLGFENYKYKNTTLHERPIGPAQHTYDTLTTNLNVNAVLLGLTVSKNVGYWNVFYFLPIINGELYLKTGGWEFAMRGGISIVTRVVDGPILYLNPCIEKKFGLTSFVCTLGCIY